MKIKYRIENFKAFTDSGIIDFSPITVLCGINSAGKSSVIKSILLAKQSSAVRRSSFSSVTSARPLILNGEFARLGSWSDMITNRERSRSLKFGWGAEVGRTEYRDALARSNIRSNLSPRVKTPKAMKVELSVVLSSDLQVAEELSIKADRWDLSIDGARIEVFLTNEKSEKGDPLYRVKIHNLSNLLSREGSQIGRYGLYLGDTIKAVTQEKGSIELGHVTVSMSGPLVGGLTPVFDQTWVQFFDAVHDIATRFRGVKRGPQPKWVTHLEAAARAFKKSLESGERSSPRSPVYRSLIFLAAEIVDEVARAHAETKAIIAPMWRDIRYLGPLRDQPRRYYQFDDTGGADVGVSGEYTVQVLALEKDAMIPARRVISLSDKGISFSDAINESLLSHTNHWLDFMGLPHVTPSSLEQSLYKLEVGHLGVGLLDVGFGVSQVLPIVVEALRAGPGDLLILEQPEIHLHPKVQATLADFLIARSLDGVRFLIESHSEYLIKRLCRRLAEAEDDQIRKSTSIFFAEGRSGDSRCNRIKINDFGEIENWPKGFFDLDEDLYWAKASLSKRRGGR